MFEHKGEFHADKQKFLRKTFFEKRIVFLEGPIYDAYISDATMPWGWSTSPRGVIDQILHLASCDSSSPIRLIIDSGGGIVAYSLNLYDVMTTVKVPIYTIGMGLVASAAVPILCAGVPGHRYIFPHTRTMIHLPTGAMQGDEKQLKIAMKQIERVKEHYISILSRHSGKTTSEIEPLIDRDYWMNAQETKEFGLIDHVVTDINEVLGFSQSVRSAVRDFDR